MPYSFLDEIATADIAFEAWAETLEEMFAAAADATMNVMVENLESIEEKETREIRLEAEAEDMLLFGLLQEIIFYKDAEELLLRLREIKITGEGTTFSVLATGYGEKIDRGRHDFIVDVKAVTLHKFKVEQTSRGWETLIILDI
ncbi:MAG: archease [Syntrophobacteraceae bacterium]